MKANTKAMRGDGFSGKECLGRVPMWPRIPIFEDAPITSCHPRLGAEEQSALGTAPDNGLLNSLETNPWLSVVDLGVHYTHLGFLSVEPVIGTLPFAHP